ncbi:MAG: M3 family oligoendopeptidase [Candidatus Sericytochromatia bacterium]|nr:M3 family oligoendopeptidase [Candidatus Sericytochromatia bacterium]
MIPVATLAAPRALTADELRARYEVLEASLPAPDAAVDAWEAWFWSWNDLRLGLAGETSRRYFRDCQDTRDGLARDAWREMREQLAPVAEQADGALRQAFLGAACREALAARLGEQLFARLELDAAAFAPENVALQVEEGDLVCAYDHLLGGAQVSDGADTLTLVQATARLTHAEPARRRGAWLAMAAWFEGHAPEFHRILGELVAVRHRQARQLGEANFVPLAYRRMGRTEYGPGEVARFREAIRRHVVPLTEALRARQARGLGLAGPLVPGADMMYFPGGTLGTEAAPVLEQTARATALFDRLDARVAAHWQRMLAEGLVDLPNRPGKRPGAFAMSIDDEGRAAIFCNSTGADSDVSTLMHEMGHAVQAWESMWIRPLELRTPTMDAAEVHSFGMEYLALREMEAFFSAAEAAQFARQRLVSTLTRLPYMAAVDAFQHALYERPELTPREREAVWHELWDTFMPGLDLSEAPMHRQYRWMRQAHIFASPFYYIDYALAETAALQLWQRARTDHAGALEAYMAMCAVGGTVSLLGMLARGGLRSPFEPEVLPPIIAEVGAVLGL